MDLKIAHTFLFVDDHDQALAFYRDALGLEVRGDVGGGKMRWVTLGSPEQPEVDIVLTPAASPNASAEDNQAIAELMAKGVLGGIVLSTSDVDAVFERVAATGAEVLQEPIDQPYGVRDCAFRDPSGNMCRINQPK
ncbi:VOC family protein [Catellatospora sp. NPDC049609]|uniref:VOC family protein n=1 Tax=Catellatospora sp. NPDC049609 TaxID=3155505 RepID=UPI003430F0FD